jgi:hypothetical protein
MHNLIKVVYNINFIKFWYILLLLEFVRRHIRFHLATGCNNSYVPHMVIIVIFDILLYLDKFP